MRKLTSSSSSSFEIEAQSHSGSRGAPDSRIAIKDPRRSSLFSLRSLAIENSPKIDQDSRFWIQRMHASINWEAASLSESAKIASGAVQDSLILFLCSRTCCKCLTSELEELFGFCGTLQSVTRLENLHQGNVII